MYFFGWCSLCFQEITYAKNIKFPSGSLCSSFVEGEREEAFCFSSVFYIRYILKMKRKPAKKKITKKRFLSI